MNDQECFTAMPSTAAISMVVDRPDPIIPAATIIVHPKRSRFLDRLLSLFQHRPQSHELKHGALLVPDQFATVAPAANAYRVPLIVPGEMPKTGNGTEQKVPQSIPSRTGSRFKFFGLFRARFPTRASHHSGELDLASSCLVPSPHEANFERHRYGSLPKSSPKAAESEDSLSEMELKILTEYLPHVHSSADVCFGKKYRLTGSAVIGKGASGVVRLGCSKQEHSPGLLPNSQLAIKEFRKRRKDEQMSHYLRKLTTEFSIASSLQNPHVVRTYDIVYDGRRWYEVMEYCTRGDLFAYIQSGALCDMDEVDVCFKQVIEGVYYLHSEGVAHRDLKPENLLIDHHGWVKITDFGVSVRFGGAQDAAGGCSAVGSQCMMTRGLCGSSPYIAPEEHVSDAYDARQVDVWAMGIIYYAMVFHGVPWESAQPKDSNYHHYLSVGAGRFEPFTRLAVGARNLLRRMLDPNPETRIKVEQIRQEPWFVSIPNRPLNLAPPHRPHQ